MNKNIQRWVKKTGVSFLVLALLLLNIPLEALAKPVQVSLREQRFQVTAAENQIEINSAADLAKIGNDPDYPLDGNYIQMANIDLSDYENWDPIGSNTSSFSGIFNGNGFTISNLTINRPGTYYQGLFGHILHATLDNVALENVNVAGDKYTGGLVGYNNASTIAKSYVAGTVTGTDSTGGLVGHLTGVGSGSDYGIIAHCYSTCNVMGTDKTGGLVGSLGSALVLDSYSTGAVTSDGNNTGGLARWCDHKATFEYCYWDKEISGQNTSAGEFGQNTLSKLQTTFVTWDFGKVWNIEEGQTYPYLRENTQSSPPGSGGLSEDSTPPTIHSFTINDGAQYTKSTEVTLKLTVDSNTTPADQLQVRFSNDGNNWSSWQSNGTGQHFWTLTSVDGPKTVYTEIQAEDIIRSGNVPAYADTEDKESIIAAVDTLKLNTVNVPIKINIPNTTSTSMSIDSDSKAFALELISELRNKNVKIILEPYPWIDGGTVPETDWDPNNISEWFHNWKTLVLEPLLNEVVIPHNIEFFYVASNLEHIEHATEHWQDIFSFVRTKYAGKILYRTNWWVTATWAPETIEAYQTKLENELFGDPNLDLISIASYFEFTDTPVPSVEELKSCFNYTTKYDRGQNVFQEIKNFYTTWGKPIFFGEIGFVSCEGCASEPWEAYPGTDYNEDAQKNCFQAYAETFTPEDWFAGFSIYCIGKEASNYSVTGKKAASIISNWNKIKAEDSIVLDTTPPSIAVEATNTGAEGRVLLLITAKDNLSSDAELEMRIANQGGTWSSWMQYQREYDWQLPSGTGDKIVLVQVKDKAGNIGQGSTLVIDDNIIGDTEENYSIFWSTTGNSGLFAYPGADGEGQQNLRVHYVRGTEVMLHLDTNLTAVSYSVDGKEWLPFETVQPTRKLNLPEGEGLKTVYARLKGGKVYVVRFVVDLTPPSINASWLGGATVTDESGRATLLLNITDNLCRMEDLELYINDERKTYQREVPLQFTGSGAKSVLIKAVDKAHNTATKVIDIIN